MPQREGSVTGFLLAPARAGPSCPASPGISSENDSHSEQMASTAWVCLPELLAEQAQVGVCQPGPCGASPSTVGAVPARPSVPRGLSPSLPARRGALCHQPSA